ncbi:MAG: hypothetical protein S4CHLAM81_13650 [Chlamydiales bacterium]|nr:hypothetical protein [Chlamydiales bacterium]MCH9636137.1 hypothetical protein [Chlamydiales bacterium]MCH9703408.1 hypothetical protein [Chlamydiota bacterium]
MSINLNTTDYSEKGYNTYRPIRALVILAALGAIGYLVVTLRHITWTKVQNFFQQKSVAWKSVAIVGGITFSAGPVLAILHRAVYGEDKAAKKLREIHGVAPTRGKFTASRYWVPIIINRTRGEDYNIMDTSTLDKEGNGACFAYMWKPSLHPEAIALQSAALGTPLQLIGKVAYQTIGWIPAAKKNGTSPLYELGRASWRVIRAPFYAAAYCIAQFAVLFDPYNGRKLVANVERDWNDGTLVQNGFALAWCGRCAKDTDSPMSGIDLGRDQHTGFFVEGCFQPTAVLVFKNNILQKVRSPSGYGENWTATLAENQSPYRLLFSQLASSCRSHGGKDE